MRNVIISAQLITIGATDCMLAYVNDLTESRQMEKHVRQAMKMEAVGRVASGLAHDFNNMLTIILGYSDLIMEQLGREGDVAQKVNQMKRAAQQAAHLVRQLLALSCQQNLRPVIINPNEIVASQQEILKQVLGTAIHFEFIPGSDLGNAKCDGNQLEQALINFAANARDAMPTGGKFTIRTENNYFNSREKNCAIPGPSGECIEISISDTGCGMDRELVPRIFDPFVTTKPNGTGLGLSMVYRFVQQSGGTISVMSEPDVGTTFTICLPVVPPDSH
jgi:signal transduction histidine kinase